MKRFGFFTFIKRLAKSKHMFDSVNTKIYLVKLSYIYIKFS